MTQQENLIIRLATHQDLPKVAQIARITWDATYNNTIAAENRHQFLERAYKVENLADAIDTPDHWFYVAEVNHEVVGFGHFLKRYHPTRTRAELVRLYVLPEFQNLKIGTTILKTGFEALFRAGIEQCFVSVQSSNQHARRFYERHGFTFHKSHGQFLGTQIITLVEYVRPVTGLEFQNLSLLEALQQQQQDMVNTLAAWVNQNSPTTNKVAVDAMGQQLAKAFVEAGATLTATHLQPIQGNHYTLTVGQDEPQILILCHFDTVWPLGEVQNRPFSLEDGRGKGPGVHDMKGGIVIALFALKAIQQLQLHPRHKLVILLTSDEEIGSPTSKALIEAEAKKSSYCLVLEGAHNKSVLTTSRKGVGRFDLEITGLAAHAGVEPQKGVSAIEELARQIQTLHAMTNFERGITVNVGVVSGGERPNIIAAHAAAEIDVRVVTQADGAAISQQILGLQPQLPGCQLHISGGINRGPFEETPAGLALYEKARAIAQELGFTVEQYSSGGGSDGNFVAALGIPTLDGLGSLGGGAHALTEYTVLAALPQRAALLAELLMRL